MIKFKTGDRIETKGGDFAEVIGDKPLGSGGQGAVYLVKYRGKKCAMKWYISDQIIKNKDAFMENLENNIRDGAPSPDFLWPKQVTEFQHGSFGYIMDLIPSNYYSMTDILKTYKYREREHAHGYDRIAVKFNTIDTMILSALRISRAFLQLARRGLSYQDLNDGGFYIDVNTGDVLICDCDNVIPDMRNLGILGKSGYMAPEVVTNRGLPCVNTDKYSLAAVLFRLLVRGDHLEGAKVHSCVTMTAGNELEHYGIHPVFVFDPNDDSNRPVIGYHKNVLRNWPMVPEYLRDLFTTTFTIGLNDPNSRPHVSKWCEALIKFRRDVVNCDCGLSGQLSMINHGDTFRCPKCGKEFNILMMGKDEMALVPGAKLYSSDITYADAEHTALDLDFSTVVSEVIENTIHPGLYGFKNLTKETWVASYKDGTVRKVEPDGGTSIKKGMKLEFGVRRNNLDKLISLQTKG